jgi:hypothetical protein
MIGGAISNAVRDATVVPVHELLTRTAAIHGGPRAIPPVLQPTPVGTADGADP